MQKHPLLISIAAPAFNEEECLPHFCHAVSEIMKTSNYDYEIVIAENGSRDNSLNVLRQLRNANSKIRFVSLSRNFGHQGGILAAIALSKGDAIITMDSDLQHPPSVIPSMIKEWENGNMVVNSTKFLNQTSFPRRMVDRLFYHLMDRFTSLDIGQADFRLMDRQVVDALLALPEKEKFLRGLVAWLGFKQKTILYQVENRLHGDSKFLRKDLVDLAIQGITSFSSKPLRMLMKFGLYLFLPSMAFLIYNIAISILSLFNKNIIIPPGWATLVGTIIFFGSVQLLAVSVLGEYIGRIYAEIKGRPSFIVRETSDSPDRNTS
jgi:glycosyltransferase involved in cell wall biosynthesis